ncbi:MAG: DUF1552 domain-containing protein [Planctomycetota bacterium]|nr:DUF1552 domain-containing protein [Planctomycetota bacterium]MDA1161855.1 DUF1552 domain-containing protein [Planctomycetota bacterium]
MTTHIRKTNQLSRRSLLRGIGATMSLPLLDAMLSTNGLAAGASSDAPLRMAYVFFPNGAIMPEWTPRTDGDKFEFSKTLKPLEPFRNNLNIISGLAQDNGRAKGDGPGDHARSASTFLTGAHPVKTAGADIRVGVSADQFAASQIGNASRLPSLELGLESGRTAGNCDSGYSCAYSSTISWKTDRTPVPKEINPKLVFERLFGGENGSPGDRAKRAKYRRSILDVVADDAQRLSKSLGKTDRQKIDEYFTSVREIEQRIEQAEQSAKLETPDFVIPDGVPKDLAEHSKLMYDLMLLAFRTDSTRIATFMLASEGSNRSYPMVGVNGGHHSLSHHRDDKQKVADLQKIDGFHVEQFAYFLKRMNETKDGDGSLLDHSMLVLGSGLGDGNRHRHDELPIVLAGGGSGTIKNGRHIRLKDETPLNNLFLSMFHRAGVKADSFGDSKGPLKEIDV